MKKRFSRLIGLVLAVSMMLSVGTSVMAEGTGQPDEFSLRVGHMLGAVAQDAQTMGMAGVNFENLYLGECVYTENGISFYPIFEGENPTPVATISTWLDESGKRRVQFGKGVEEILLARGIVFDVNDAKKVNALNTYAVTGKSLSVPTVAQGTTPNNMLCWAACISSVAAYRGKGNMTPLSIANASGKTATSGAGIYEIGQVLWSIFGINYTTYGTNDLYCNAIFNCIDNNNPILVKMVLLESVNPHTVLVYGYINNDGAPYGDYIHYMDPDQYGSRNMVTIPRGSEFQYTMNNPANNPPVSTYHSYGYVVAGS